MGRGLVEFLGALYYSCRALVLKGWLKDEMSNDVAEPDTNAPVRSRVRTQMRHRT
jgi:hypothetical protein